MTYEEIIKALRACAVTACADCPLDKNGAGCTSLNTEAASTIENLVELARENDKREDEAEEHAANNILRGELRRMFQLYVAAEMRADTGTEERDDD